MDSFADINEVTEFACKTNVSIDWLKMKAKKLKLIITMTGRSRHKPQDRIGFGLRKKVSKAIKNSNKDFKIASTLFKFGIQVNGFFKPSDANKTNLGVYKFCKSEYVEVLNLADILEVQNSEYKRKKE